MRDLYEELSDLQIKLDKNEKARIFEIDTHDVGFLHVIVVITADTFGYDSATRWIVAERHVDMYDEGVVYWYVTVKDIKPHGERDPELAFRDAAGEVFYIVTGDGRARVHG